MAAGSVIGPGTVVRGNVRGAGALEVLGRVEGDVSVDGDIVLGAAAAVRGNVSGAQVSVSGAVQGDLRGSEAVLVESGARVVGDVLAPRIGIADGALVRGSVRTEGEPALAQPVRRPAVGARPVSAFAPRPMAVATARSPDQRPVEPRPAEQRAAEHRPRNDADQAQAKSSPDQEPPPPVVPALPKNARGKKKSRPK